MLILWGGEDIHPRLYNQPIRYAIGINPKRDAREVRAYHNAISRSIPILGICRGHQLIAALRGGALFQDMLIEAGLYHDYRHAVNLEDEFKALFGSHRILVNSIHHQAVSVVPEGGRVVARCDGGIVEAIYYPGIDTLPPMLGVQWHPEMMDNEHFEKIRDFLYKKYAEWREK